MALKMHLKICKLGIVAWMNERTKKTNCVKFYILSTTTVPSNLSSAIHIPLTLIYQYIIPEITAHTGNIIEVMQFS